MSATTSAKRTHRAADLTEQALGQTVTLCGWVHRRRDHGALSFIDLRDRSGLTQVVFHAKANAELHQQAKTLGPEYVVAITGTVRPRPKGTENPKLASGLVEIGATALTVLNAAQTPPFEVDDQLEVSEDVRMQWRFIDLRRPAFQQRLMLRHRIIHQIRQTLDTRGFIEIETPILTKSTPEGARDYLVPSRIAPGNFYALPQSPQQYKQLLMVAGVEKYFQVARCFRDEDTRGDRQPEFTQLDLEMSFVNQEDVMKLTEELLIELVQKLYPEKKIQEIPFPRFSYKEAMEKYGSDKPDIRKDKNDMNLLAFCWVVDFPFFEKTDEGSWTFTHNPFSAPKPEHMGNLLAEEKIGEILTTQYDIALNGFEIGGGSIRNHQPEALRVVFKIMGFSNERTEKNFGHMLQALSSGAPPHGGIAPGLDRLLMILQNEPNIREVIPFAKTGDGRDPMMGSPGEVEQKQLDELSLEIKKKR